MKKNVFLLAVMAIALLLTSGAKRPVTLFMVGDSTMADKTELEASPERGWGQLFPTYLNEKIVVQNHAKNGRSTKSFLDEGRWAEVLNRAQKGDIVIIQFGHNDPKQADPDRYTPIKQFEKNLVKMITEAQAKDMQVILCTPIARRQWKDGDLMATHGGYPKSVKKVAAKMEVPVLDLETATTDWLRQEGEEGSKQYFMNVAAGECTKYPDGKTDNTHLREAGALKVGEMAAKMIVEQKLKPLSKYIVLPASDAKYTTPCGIQ